MKRLNKNHKHANKIDGADVQPAFFGKSAYRHNAKIVAAIIAVIVLHSVLHFTFFRTEEVSLKAETAVQEITEIKPEIAQSVETETASASKKPDIVKPEAAKPDVVKTRNAAVPALPPEPKIVRTRFVIKKQEPRISRAERLRRAEKILTGV